MKVYCASLVILAWAAVVPAAERAEDPAASKLLAEARAARVNWENFPGFKADVAVNFDGKVSRGQVHVDSKGKVAFEGLDKGAEAWARRVLGSTVAHRLDGSAAKNTPCAFADDQAHHPLGRKIQVLNDELHSSYRILERQIMVVNRAMGNSKFTISMQENRTNADGKFLPVSYVVNYWDSNTGALQKSEAHYQTWKRVGGFDLPVLTRVVSAVPEAGTTNPAPGGTPAAKEGLDAKSLTLSNHKLDK